MIKKKKNEAQLFRKRCIKILITLAVLLVIIAIVNLLCIYLWDVHFYDKDGKRTTYEPYLTLDLIVLGIALMVFDYPAEGVMLTIAFLYCITGCQSLEETLDGFANKGVIAVCLLCIVAKGINETKSLDSIFKFVLGNSKNIMMGMLRLCALAIVFSAFLNNTPLVALLIPLIESWCITNGLPKQVFLIPLSIMSILGGGCSQIGSSVNIIAISKAEDDDRWK